MVCIGVCIVNNVPSLVVSQPLFIDQDAKELDSRDGWVGIVQLNLILLRELCPICHFVPISMTLFKSLDDVA